MVTDQNQDRTNNEPAEDGLSALRRLTALDNAGAGASRQDSSSQTDDLVEKIPDWLELLLAKYGEQASELEGIQPDLPMIAQLDDTSQDKETSEVASLLEQMATEAEKEPPSEQPVTSVDWGEPARLEDEAIEDQTPDWLAQVAEPSAPPPEPPAGEETPEWLDEIGEPTPETEIAPERPESAQYPDDVEEVPDWLHELTPPSQPPAAPPETAPPEAEVPDWLEDLGEMAPSLEAPRAEETPPVPEDEVPDWMKELGITTPGVEPLETEATPPISEGEVPDWLKDLDIAAADDEEVLPVPQAPEAPPDIAKPEEVEAEIPNWLARLADGAASEAEEALPAEPAPAEFPPTPPPETAAEAPPEPEEMPDWLYKLEVAEEAPAAEPTPPEPPVAQPPEMAAEAPEEPEAVPDWLHKLEVAEEAPAAEPETEAPDWLTSLREEQPSPLEMMVEEETPPADYPEGEEAEEPEWLAALRTTDKPDMLELDEEVVEAEEEPLPDWLAELRASKAAAEMPPPTPEKPPKPIEKEGVGPEEEYHPPAEPVVEIPEVEQVQPPPAEVEYTAAEEASSLDWLAEIEAAAVEVPEYTEGEKPPAKAEAPPEPEEEVPDWLLQMPPVDLSAEEVAPEKEKETVETRRPPEWLIAEPPPAPEEEEVEVSPPEEEAPEIAEPMPAAEEGAPAEIPEWLMELKPEEAVAEESEDVLAGIPGLLPIAEEEPEIEEEPIAALRARIGVPEVPDVEGAKVFQEVVAKPPAGKEEIEAKPETEARRGRIMETLVWALVFIILIAGIALALLAVLDRVGDLLGGPAFREFFGSPMVIDPAPVNTFRAQVTKLPPDSVVVVSFDYGPATEAEMEPLAQIIVRDLLENQARVVAVSLRPEGTIMAQRLFERFENEYPYGERTINLGYLPGQTAGVRSLAFLTSAPLYQNWTQTLGDYPAWQDVDGLGDVALIVAIADSPLPVRWWVEQMGPGSPANRPMVAAVSAAADPSVRPYYNQIDPKSGQLLGLVSSVTDAAAYENRLGQPGRAVRSLAAQSVAHLGLVVVGLGGTIAGFRTQVSGQ